MVVNKSATAVKKQNVKEKKPATPQKPKAKAKSKPKWKESVFSDEDESDGYDEAEDKNVDMEEASPEKIKEEEEESLEKNKEGNDDDTESKEEEETMKASSSSIVSDSQSYVTPEQVMINFAYIATHVIKNLTLLLLFKNSIGYKWSDFQNVFLFFHLFLSFCFDV